MNIYKSNKGSHMQMYLIIVVVCACIVPHFTYAADIRTGLVGWWKLDEGSGINIVDSTGHGSTGSFVAGPTAWITGKTGPYAATFSGSDYAVAPIDAAYNVPNKFTLSAWFNSTEGAGWDSIVAKVHSGSPYNGYILALYQGSLLLFTGSDTSTHFDWTTTNAGGYADGQWHHVVAVFNGVTRSIYIDGVFAPSTPNAYSDWTGWTIGNTADDVWIGNDQTWDPFQGSLDDVRIYNRALSTTDITALYAYTGFERNMRTAISSLKRFVVKVGSQYHVTRSF